MTDSTKLVLPRSARFAGAKITTPRIVEAQEETPQESIDGQIESLKIFGNWAVGTITTTAKQTVKITGESITDLQEGDSYTFRGTRRVHPQHGESFEVANAVTYITPTQNGIQKYLERNFSGIGPAKAAEFVEMYLGENIDKEGALEELRQKLLSAPWALDLSAVSDKAAFKPKFGAEGAASSTMLEYVYRDFSTKLGGVPGMKDGILRPLASHVLKSVGNAPKGQGEGVMLDPALVAKAWEHLAGDPYEPISEVSGYGFGLADLIGKFLGIPNDAPIRLRALVAHALDDGCAQSGHVYLTRAQIENSVRHLDGSISAPMAVELGVEEGLIETVTEGAEVRYYPPKLLAAEIGLSAHLARMCEPSTPLTGLKGEALRRRIVEIAREISSGWPKPLELDEVQILSLIGIATSTKRIHTLTAGPGRGKTALMEVLTVLLKEKEMMFVGPTGKSAKVLTGRLRAHGKQATTIHSAFQGADPASFQVNASAPLEDDVLVIDEGSMVDLELAKAVFDAVPSKMHVIVLGDHNQLPSVSPGAVLRDLLEIKSLDHHRLLEPHRNSGGILDVVTQVEKGQIDCQDRQSVNFSHGLGEATEDFSTVAAKYVAAVQEHGVENVVLLMSKRKGEAHVPGWNVNYANAQLQGICNPGAVRIPGTKFFVNDRIIIRENLKIENTEGEATSVVNGDTGKITSWTKKDDSRQAGAKHLTIRLDDDRLVNLRGEKVAVMQHSYALTVHSAQGSEYKHVIAVVTSGSPAFINCAMLFTGISRAKEQLVVFGNDSDIRKVAATPLPRRNSALAQRTRARLGEVAPAHQSEPYALKYPLSSGSVAGSRAARFSDRESSPVTQMVQSNGGSRASRFRVSDEDKKIIDQGLHGAKQEIGEVAQATNSSTADHVPLLAKNQGDEQAADAMATAYAEAQRISDVKPSPAVSAQDVPLIPISGRTRSWPARSQSGAAEIDIGRAARFRQRM